MDDVSSVPSKTNKDQHPAALRLQRFMHGAAASAVSKVLGVAVHLQALPLALLMLGTDRYAAFLALQSFLSWIGLCGFGLPYSLPKYIAAANVAGDHDEERRLVVSSILLISCSSIAILVLLSVLGLLVAPETLIASAADVSSSEVRIGYVVAAFVNVLMLSAVHQSTIRTGYQEVHRAGICATLASAAVLVGLFCLPHQPSISIFIVVLYLPLSVAFLVDMALLFKQRPYLRKGPIDFRATIAKIARPTGNALAYQLQGALVLYLPTIAMAHLTTPTETALLGSLLQLVVLATNSLNLLFQPLTAAIANAHGHGDFNWIRRNHRRTLFLMIGLGLLGIALSATVGPAVVGWWLHAKLYVPALLLVCTAFFFMSMAIMQAEFFVLSAIGALHGTGKFMALAGALALCAGSILCVRFGAVGMTLGLSFSMAVSAVWLNRRLRNELRAGPGATA